MVGMLRSDVAGALLSAPLLGDAGLYGFFVSVAAIVPEKEDLIVRFRSLQ